MNHTLRFGSVCSGIEAASVAWAPLGWSAAWLAEIEPFPSAVLAHHYPDTPNLGDMTTIARRVLTGEVEAPEVFTGGTPCQAFSVAGLRKSLDDARGNLSLKFVELADAIDHVRGRAGEPPCIVIWENVPGVLSTKDNAFGCFLAGLAGEDEPLQPPGGKWTNAGCVSGPQRTVAWRVLDAQYFGLAQRRRRVFVVASARKGFDPAQVLFEWGGVRRDTAPSREAGQEATATLAARTDGGGFPGTDEALSGYVQPVAQCLTRGTGQRYDPETETILPVTAHTQRGEGFDAGEDGTGRGTPLVPVAYAIGSHAGAADGDQTNRSHSSGGPVGSNISEELAYSLRAGRTQSVASVQPLPFDTSQESAVFLHANKGRPGGRQSAHTEMVSVKPLVETLTTDGHAQSAVFTPAMQVRRLTPTEAERLMGFPDGYTAIPWRKKPASECPDGPRYKALGNSWAVPVARWVGARITQHLEHA